AGDVLVEGRLGRDALHLAVGIDPAVVLAAGEAVEPPADDAVAPEEPVLLDAAQIGDGGDAVAGELRLERLAHAPDQADGFGAQEVQHRGPADDRVAPRLVEIRGDLRQELVVAEADGHGDPDAPLDLEGEAGKGAGRAAVMELRGAGEIEEGLVDGERLD